MKALLAGNLESVRYGNRVFDNRRTGSYPLPNINNTMPSSRPISCAQPQQVTDSESLLALVLSLAIAISNWISASIARIGFALLFICTAVAPFLISSIKLFFSWRLRLISEYKDINGAINLILQNPIMLDKKRNAQAQSSVTCATTEMVGSNFPV